MEVVIVSTGGKRRAWRGRPPTELVEMETRTKIDGKTLPQIDALASLYGKRFAIERTPEGTYAFIE